MREDYLKYSGSEILRNTSNFTSEPSLSQNIETSHIVYTATIQEVLTDNKITVWQINYTNVTLTLLILNSVDVGGSG